MYLNVSLCCRLQVPVKVSIVFARGREKPASGISKSLWYVNASVSQAYNNNQTVYLMLQNNSRVGFRMSKAIILSF